MPSNVIGLDSTGSGTWRVPLRINQLSILNQSNQSINLQINEIGESLLIGPNTAIEFEEDEAREVNAVHITNGAANSRSIIVYWTPATFIEHYLPH